MTRVYSVEPADCDMWSCVGPHPCGEEHWRFRVALEPPPRNAIHSVFVYGSEKDMHRIGAYARAHEEIPVDESLLYRLLDLRDGPRLGYASAL